MRNPRLFIAASVVTFALFLLVLGACKKNEVSVDESSYASDHTLSEMAFNDVEIIADQASRVPSGALGYKGTGTGCATVTQSPGLIVVDFGSSECTCNDGRTRRGKILVSYTDTYNAVTSKHTITFDNYYLNNNKITGTKIITNRTADYMGRPQCFVTTDMAVTRAGGGTVTSHFMRDRLWSKGYDTPGDISDDEYQISGSGTMTRVNGAVIDINISGHLTTLLNCHWIVMGRVIYNLNGSASRQLNYGDSPICDNLASISLSNGNTIVPVTLP